MMPGMGVKKGPAKGWPLFTMFLTIANRGLVHRLRDWSDPVQGLAQFGVGRRIYLAERHGPERYLAFAVDYEQCPVVDEISVTSLAAEIRTGARRDRAVSASPRNRSAWDGSIVWSDDDGKDGRASVRRRDRP